jgi:FADH2 O2-dependent halogenase
MHHDLAIIGSGFGGSITALVAKQVGMEPVLIERGKHPRFAIGESSTPQADIALASIADTYNLPRLKPLARYGTWKETYPELTCGPKRGFTYVCHPNIADELLVAASPDQYNADSHWYRADLDAFLVDEVKAAGIAYFDETNLTTVEQGSTWKLEAENFACTADFVVDATGGANPLGIPQDTTKIRTNSRVLYSHFNNVSPWSNKHGKPHHPYPCHEAALHHIFEGGWMYVLHFDNGITSAGFVLDNVKHPLDETISPEVEWNALLHRYPAIKEQFLHATPTMPLVQTGRMQRCTKQVAGENWAMLPHAAYFLDPLHSAGNAHTLCGIERLMPILTAPASDRHSLLHGYQATTLHEVDLLDKIIHGCYLCFDNFKLLSHYAMLYFAGADFTERQRRAGKASSFLNSNDGAFCNMVDVFYRQMVEGSIDVASIAAAIEPWNLVGLCDPSKQNMYDYAQT